MIWIPVLLVVYGLLVLVTAIEPYRSSLSEFELTRRAKIAAGEIERDVLRERQYETVMALLRIASGLLLVVWVLASVAVLGWLIGSLVAIVGVLEYVAISRLGWVSRTGQKLYDLIEHNVLAFVDRHNAKLVVLRGVARQSSAPLRMVASREELLHMVAQAKDVLSSDERRLITSSMSFTDTPIIDSMTPRSVIDSVASGDILGPLLLDELHKTGHSRFPVIDGDIDHVVGVLHLRDIIAISGAQTTKTAADMMKTPVYYIKETQTLSHALAAFLRVKHHLFVVVNEYRETVGIITLEDVIEAMIGRKIIDEFDAHEDLRAVAARNPRKNNSPASGKMV